MTPIDATRRNAAIKEYRERTSNIEDVSGSADSF
jgi:pilus assembly protein CpaD